MLRVGVLGLVPLLLLATAPEARAEEPMTVVLAFALDPVLEARIQGQLADLAIVLRRGDEAREPSTIEALLASASDARVVAWATSDETTVELVVIDVLARRAFVRSFEGGSRSARFEEAAVSLRSTLIALSLGGEIGVAIPAPEPPPPIVEPPPPPPVVAEEEAPAPSIRVLALAGAALSADGLDRPALGALLGLRLARGDFFVGLTGSIDGARDVADASTRLQVRRGGALVDLGLRVVRARHVSLELSARLGVLVFGRATMSAPPDATGTPRSREASPFGGIGAELVLLPIADRAVGLSLGGFLDVAFAPPRFEARFGDTLDVVDRASTLLPSARLMLRVPLSR